MVREERLFGETKVRLELEKDPKEGKPSGRAEQECGHPFFPRDVAESKVRVPTVERSLAGLGLDFHLLNSIINFR